MLRENCVEGNIKSACAPPIITSERHRDYMWLGDILIYV